MGINKKFKDYVSIIPLRKRERVNKIKREIIRLIRDNTLKVKKAKKKKKKKGN